MSAAGQDALEAAIGTANAHRYLSQLCKHFQHRCPVTLEADAGLITFAERGTCRLRATGDALFLILEPLEAAQSEALRDVIERHLRRFAFREDLAIRWRPAG